MKLRIILSLFCIFIATNFVSAQKVDNGLKQQLEPVYKIWRNAMITKNHPLWKKVTAKNRIVTIYNRINSEKRPYPASIFQVPVTPPSIQNLRAINVNSKGRTAVATYFGKINFGVGGNPTDNIMLLHFVLESKGWRFDKAEYINLVALPSVRKQMQAGNFSYANHKDFRATGKTPTTPAIIKSMGYIAKVYAFCPGREIKVNINGGRSIHRFQNDKRAETIIAGARDGQNFISFSTKPLPGSKGNESINLRVFLMSQIKGVKPIEVFNYSITPAQAKAGKKPHRQKSTSFNVTPEHVKRLYNVKK